MSIFNKRTQDVAPTPVPRPPAAVPPSNPIEPAKQEATPLSTVPFNTPAPDALREQVSSPASIGKAVKIIGQMYSKEDLYVDGDVEGTIELEAHRLTIGPHGKVRSNIKAREVVILGNVQGNVEASDKLEVRRDGRLVGDTRTARIVIEDGAYFKGSIDIVKAEPSKSSDNLQPKPLVMVQRASSGGGTLPR